MDVRARAALGRWTSQPTRAHGGGWRGCVCRRTGAPSRPRAACDAATASGEQLASRRAEHREERGSSNLPMSSASSSSLPRIGERPLLPPLTDVRSGRHRPQRHGRAAHAEATQGRGVGRPQRGQVDRRVCHARCSVLML